MKRIFATPANSCRYVVEGKEVKLCNANLATILTMRRVQDILNKKGVGTQDESWMVIMMMMMMMVNVGITSCPWHTTLPIGSLSRKYFPCFWMHWFTHNLLKEGGYSFGISLANEEVQNTRICIYVRTFLVWGGRVWCGTAQIILLLNLNGPESKANEGVNAGACPGGRSRIRSIECISSNHKRQILEIPRMHWIQNS